jgi:putative transposase
VWLYFRFPLGLRMVEELLAARCIIVGPESVRQWARKFGQQFANQIRRRLSRLATNGICTRSCSNTGVKHWLWRAVDQAGIVLNVLVQRRRNRGDERLLAADPRHFENTRPRRGISLREQLDFRQYSY